MRLLRRLAGVFAGLGLALASATAAFAAPPFWAVKDEDSTIYLFGTMHILTPDAEWRTPAFDKAMASARVVWFEADVEGDPQGMMRLMVEHGVDLTTPLAAKVPGETMTALRATLKDQPLFGQMAESMEPWAAGMIVQVMPMIGNGFDPKAGADSVLGRDAARDGKTVRYFETAEEQLMFFAGMSRAAQVEFLQDSLEGADQDEDEAKAMQQAWIDGDVEKFGPLIVGEMRKERPELYDALIRRRNAAWVVTLEKEMAGSGVQMVNVGALHMVGDDGLVAQLRARGFTVERIQ